MSALDKVLAASGYRAESDGAPASYDPGTELVLGAQYALGEAAYFLLLAAEDDDDSQPSTDHTSHSTYKAMVAKGMNKSLAAKMCAKSDANKAAASAVAEALLELSQLDVPDLRLSVTQADRDKAHDAGNSLPDKSYPINNVKQLHSAAVLAASKHGDYKAAQSLIRRRAKELGVDVNSLPGFGSSDGDADDQKAAATAYAMSVLQLAQGAVDRPGAYSSKIAKGMLPRHDSMHHAPFTGQHSHAHHLHVAHEHPHMHNNDNSHEHAPGY